MKTIGTIIICIAITAAFFAGRRCGGELPAAVTRIDTLIVRDTVRDTVFVPVSRLAVRTDTVFVKVAGDTVRIAAEVPIERKVYATDDYRAVVEGFRPALVGMEIYRNTLHIDRETTRAPPSGRRNTGRWGIGVQAGYGLTPQGPAPYLGVGVQYNVITW